MKTDIIPYTKGAGKYPNIVQHMFATEFACDFWYSPTELIIIPVSDGKMNPPKKRSNQISHPTTRNEEKNGIGKAHATAHRPINLNNLKDLIVLQPPNAVVITPPIMTPATGAVKQVVVKNIET